jgi:hypothetical protein
MSSGQKIIDGLKEAIEHACNATGVRISVYRTGYEGWRIGPPRAVPAGTQMPFPGHRTLGEIMTYGGVK